LAVADRWGSTSSSGSFLFFESARKAISINTQGLVTALLLQNDSVWSASSSQSVCENNHSSISRRDRDGRLRYQTVLDRAGSVLDLKIDSAGFVWAVIGKCTGIIVGRSFVIRLNSDLKDERTVYAGDAPIEQLIFVRNK